VCVVAAVQSAVCARIAGRGGGGGRVTALWDEVGAGFGGAAGAGDGDVDQRPSYVFG
jgi:hypothetical protein